MLMLNQADAPGQIDIGGKTWPVSYHVIARDGEDNDSAQVHIEVSLPRDWLVERGFRSEAVLIRENGDRTTIRAGDDVDSSDPISIILESDALRADDSEQLLSHFPELKLQ